MATQRWDPLRDLIRVQENINRMFEELLARSGENERGETLIRTGWKPAVDVVEQPDRYLLLADLPGMTSSDVDLEIEDSTLILRGERRGDPSITRESLLREERPRGRFSLQIALPPSVDRQGIRASHRDGVLEVTLPKREDRSQGRIKIQVR